MTSLGAYEAKTHFSALLERVARGERIAITAIEELLRFRRGRKASRRTIRRWIAEGRS